MRILVVCGAGASSTFVAQRLRNAAARSGLHAEVAAGTEDTLGTLAGPVDVVLVGPHLESAFARIQDAVGATGAITVLLPRDAFEDRDGSRILEIVTAARASSVTE
jgi:PTS system cellobiose-specific IIB component